MFKKVSCEQKGIMQLRFVDHIILIATRIDEAQNMLTNTNIATKEVGLQINFSRTQFILP